MNDIIVNKDSRRTLFDLGAVNCASLKFLISHQAKPIGDHYHLKKDEVFYLLAGSFLELHLGEEITYNIGAPVKITVPKGMYHKFILEPNSLLIGTSSEPFDLNDEHKKDA